MASDQIRSHPRENSVDPMPETFTALTEERPVISPKWNSPANIISAASFVLTTAIIGMLVYWKDGVALGTSIMGYASWWRPVLMALGTAMLMVSIVLLGNVGFAGQTVVGASYIVLNGAYWLASMVSREHYWDLSRYEWCDVTPRDARQADRTTDLNDVCDGYRSFTRTLWFAIRETESSRWAERSGAAPGTRRWRQWLRESEENATAGNRRWAAVTRRDHIFADDGEDALR
ncbi:hypothetical protein Daus18300_003744 [Diaporthe australafricana]|uniref:Uncharacterized protein n=1 Tax=Diaporthe australafricana TaxID=127596 RepID=A0ABR3XD39_9PEZI